MTGEPESRHGITGWTVETLRAYFDRLFVEKEKRDEQRYIAQQEGVDRALMAAEKAVNAALAAADRAISKAEDASERRLDILNEFRQTVENLVKQAPTRAELEPRFSALTEKLSDIVTETRVMADRMREEHQRDTQSIRDDFQRAVSSLALNQAGIAGRDRGLSLSWSIVMAAAALSVAITALIIKLAGG